MFLPKFKKDRIDRFKFYKFEAVMSAKKFIINSAFFLSEIRVKARYEIFFLFDKYKVSRNYTNRCLLTGHPKVAFRKYRISRMEFRRLAKIGVLKGLRKSSWLFFKCVRFLILFRILGMQDRFKICLHLCLFHNLIYVRLIYFILKD